MSYINTKRNTYGIIKKEYHSIPTCPTCGSKKCTEITKEYSKNENFDPENEVAFRCLGKRVVKFVVFNDGKNQKSVEEIDCETEFVYRKVKKQTREIF